MATFLSVSAPGRVCLFGEHQDYLKLYVIPCAIDLRTCVSGSITNKGSVDVMSDVDGGVKDSFHANEKSSYCGGKLDYLRAVVNVILDEGYKIGGVKCNITSDIPLKSGLSSSAALSVAWVKFLSEAFGLSLTREQIAMIAYRAEHDELKIPCGLMDQFSSSLGGMFFMECSEKPETEKIVTKISKFVVVDTGIRKATREVHGKRVAEIKSAVQKLSDYMEVDLKKIRYEEVVPHLDKMPEVLAKRLAGSILNRDLTLSAKAELEKSSLDEERIGELLNMQQRYLKEYIEVSVPEIEKIIKASLEAGAKGGKLTGAGMGGSVVVYAPGKEASVASRVSKMGFKTYIVSIDDGARAEKKSG